MEPYMYKENRPISSTRLLQLSTCQQNSNVWENARKCFFTASNVGAILGVGRFKTRNAIYRNMRYNIPEPPKNSYTKDILQYGRSHEPKARVVFHNWLNGHYKDKINVEECLPQAMVYATGLHVYCGGGPLHHWVAASPDALVGCNEKRIFSLLEVKCPFKKEIFDAVYESPDQNISNDHYVQVQTQLQCCNSAPTENALKHAYYALYDGNTRMVVYKVFRDDVVWEHIQKTLLLFKGMMTKQATQREMSVRSEEVHAVVSMLGNSQDVNCILIGVFDVADNVKQ